MGEIVKYRGDVRNLKVYRLAKAISFLTEVFVKRYIRPGSRTIDQMQQAARSCKQNIVEGSQAASTSKETEIKLTNVANASLGELQEDYIDYLEFNNLDKWDISHPRIMRLRAYLRTEDFFLTYRNMSEKLTPEEFCNLMITLISQTQYLLCKLIKSQEQRFIAEGGIREAMTKARLQARNLQK